MANFTQMIVSVNGRRMYGWQNIEIFRSMDNIAGTFTVTHHRLNPNLLPIGAECSVILGDYILANGYIEDITSEISADGLSWRLSGRDKTGNLVDCGYVTDETQGNFPAQFENISLYEIIRKLCVRFGIGVSLNSRYRADIFKKINFTVNEGDTVFESINRICRLNSLLALSYGDGRIYLTRAEDERYAQPLNMGKNILSAKLHISNLNRHSVYIVKGTKKPESVFDLGKDLQIAQPAYDKTVTPYRPLIMLDTALNSAEEASVKAKWERDNRAGQSRTYSCTVDGWTSLKDNSLWRINRLVKVKDELRGIDGQTMIIKSTRYTVSPNDGQQTQMVLVDPITYKSNRPTTTEDVQNSDFDVNSIPLTAPQYRGK